MIARVKALTGLGFDVEAIKAAVNPNIDGEVYDSLEGSPVSRHSPHIRTILSPDAIHHGPIRDSNEPGEERINERVHWSAQKKRGRPLKRERLLPNQTGFSWPSVEGAAAWGRRTQHRA
jgi:hypothetical protein